MIADIRLNPLPVSPSGQVPHANDLQHLMRPGLLQLAALPPLSLYVHLPWCLKKCPYCDFNSHENTTSELPEQRYIEALIADLEAALPLVWGRTVHSIFIGGGTPSLFSPLSIDQLLAGIRARLRLAADCEITLEANPGTFEKNRFRAYRSAGVNRLSVGVQSFNDTHLKALGRVHDRAQAMAAVEEAASAFDTFNIDIMYALPGQTLAEQAQDMRQALAFSPPHVSIYHLTVEPNTAFAKYPPPDLPEDDTAYAMLDQIAELTAASVGGLQRYEVSAFAKAGHRCFHNLNYWNFGDYLGIGAGAHSKISFAHRVVRQSRFRSPQSYMDKALGVSSTDADGSQAIAEQTEVKRSDLAFEYMLGALRLVDGFALSQLRERTGLPMSAVEPQLLAAVQQGYLLYDRALQTVCPTPRGLDFLNDVQMLFLND